MSYTVLKSEEDFEKHKVYRADCHGYSGDRANHVEHWHEPEQYPCLVEESFSHAGYSYGDSDKIYYYFTYPSDVLKMAKALEMNL